MTPHIPNPKLKEMAAMSSSPTSLHEEFDQYKTLLTKLKLQLELLTSQNSSIDYGDLLLETTMGIMTLTSFMPEQCTSTEIHRMSKHVLAILTRAQKLHGIYICL